MRTADDFELHCQANATDSKPIELTELLTFFKLREGDYLVMPRMQKMARVYVRIQGQPMVATIDQYANILPLCDYGRRPPAYLYLHTASPEEIEDTVDVLNHRLVTSGGDTKNQATQLLERARKIFA